MKYLLTFTDKKDDSQLISCAECNNMSDVEALALQFALYLCYNQNANPPKAYHHLSFFATQVLAEAIEGLMEIDVCPFDETNPMHKYALICQKMKPLQITENKPKKGYTYDT